MSRTINASTHGQGTEAAERNPVVPGGDTESLDRNSVEPEGDVVHKAVDQDKTSTPDISLVKRDFHSIKARHTLRVKEALGALTGPSNRPVDPQTVLGPRYFVTEPVDPISLISSQPTISNPLVSPIQIEEVSPNSSPIHNDLRTKVVDDCMSTVFNWLTLKRKACEDDDEGRSPKLLKCAALTDVPRQPSKISTTLSQKHSSGWSNSRSKRTTSKPKSLHQTLQNQMSVVHKSRVRSHLSAVMTLKFGPWWLAPNSHNLHVNSQLELSGDGVTPDSPDPPRVIATHRPMVVSLMEAKNKLVYLERICRRLSFNQKCYVDPEGASCGLALWWNDEIHMDIRFKSKFMIRGVITSDNSSCWAVSFVYAPSQRSVRRVFWDQFQKFASENLYPWLCIGDFNEIGLLEEKMGGAECRMSQLQSFLELLSDCALMDLEFNGLPFTWSNNQHGCANIRERLDRAVTTVEWRALFPCAQVFHELLVGSDHCPVVLNCCVPLKRVPRLFKFETMWSTNPDCVECCRDGLKRWSKAHFENNSLNIVLIKSKLLSL
ncbi:hypothetical protein ACSBR1_040730 [Camellia fascicularis]